MKNAIYKRLTANLAAHLQAASAGTPDDDQQVDPAYVGGNMRAVVALVAPGLAAQPLAGMLIDRIARYMVVEAVVESVSPAERIEAALLDRERQPAQPLLWEPRPQGAPPPPSRPSAPRDPYGRLAGSAPMVPAVQPAGAEPPRDAYGRLAGAEPPPVSAPVQLDVDGVPAAVAAQPGFDQFGRPLPPAGWTPPAEPEPEPAPVPEPGAARVGLFEEVQIVAEGLRRLGWSEEQASQILASVIAMAPVRAGGH